MRINKLLFRLFLGMLIFLTFSCMTHTKPTHTYTNYIFLYKNNTLRISTDNNVITNIKTNIIEENNLNGFKITGKLFSFIDSDKDTNIDCITIKKDNDSVILKIGDTINTAWLKTVIYPYLLIDIIIQ